MMQEELKELRHEPVPGYKKVFFIIFTTAAVYLTVILLNTL